MIPLKRLVYHLIALIHIFQHIRVIAIKSAIELDHQSVQDGSLIKFLQEPIAKPKRHNFEAGNTVSKFPIPNITNYVHVSGHEKVHHQVIVFPLGSVQTTNSKPSADTQQQHDFSNFSRAGNFPVPKQELDRLLKIASSLGHQFADFVDQHTTTTKPPELNTGTSLHEKPSGIKHGTINHLQFKPILERNVPAEPKSVAVHNSMKQNLLHQQRMLINRNTFLHNNQRRQLLLGKIQNEKANIRHLQQQSFPRVGINRMSRVTSAMKGVLSTQRIARNRVNKNRLIAASPSGRAVIIPQTASLRRPPFLSQLKPHRQQMVSSVKRTISKVSPRRLNVASALGMQKSPFLRQNNFPRRNLRTRKTLFNPFKRKTVSKPKVLIKPTHHNSYIPGHLLINTIPVISNPRKSNIPKKRIVINEQLHREISRIPLHKKQFYTHGRAKNPLVTNGMRHKKYFGLFKSRPYRFNV